jgi:hypothetical protein
LSLKEESELEHTVRNYFINRVPVNSSVVRRYMMERPAELFFCVFSVDSSGRVRHINLLSDDKNRDSAFAIFSRMIPEDLKDWQCEKCGGKTLMILIGVENSNDNKPLYYQNTEYSGFFRTREANNLIIVRGMWLMWPQIICEYQGVSSILDSSVNNKPKPVKSVER